MDDLLREFLTETDESLDRVDAELVRFEQEPNNGEILGNIFRLVHTIKGTCGFLGLPRLEALAHSAENLMGEFRDGMPVTTEAVTVILSTIDRIKTILEELEAEQREPTGNDGDLIERLNWLSRRAVRALRSRARNDAVPPAPDRRERRMPRLPLPRPATHPPPPLPSAQMPSQAKSWRASRSASMSRRSIAS